MNNTRLFKNCGYTSIHERLRLADYAKPNPIGKELTRINSIIKSNPKYSLR